MILKRIACLYLCLTITTLASPVSAGAASLAASSGCEGASGARGAKDGQIVAWAWNQSCSKSNVSDSAPAVSEPRTKAPFTKRHGGVSHAPAQAKPDPINGRIAGTGSWNGRGPNPCANTPGGTPMTITDAQFSGGTGLANTIRNLGGFCIPPTAPAAPGQPAVPAPPPPPPVVITAQEFKTLPLKERTTMCSCTPDENNKPSGVVTVPIAFWQDTEPETITTTLLGQIVQVQATPTQWAYNFGNGQTLTTTNPGIPYHENPKTTPPSTIPNTIWTSYEHRGNYPIRQTITYNAQYSVNGGPWQPIQGTAQRPGPSLDIPIKSFIALEVAPNY